MMGRGEDGSYCFGLSPPDSLPPTAVGHHVQSRRGLIATLIRPISSGRTIHVAGWTWPCSRREYSNTQVNQTPVYTFTWRRTGLHAPPTAETDMATHDLIAHSKRAHTARLVTYVRRNGQRKNKQLHMTSFICTVSIRPLRTLLWLGVSC